MNGRIDVKGGFTNQEVIINRTTEITEISETQKDDYCNKGSFDRREGLENAQMALWLEINRYSFFEKFSWRYCWGR